MNTEFQRVHPLTIAVSLVDVLKRMLLLVGYVLFSIVANRGEGGFDTGEFIGTAVGSFALISAALQYWFFRFKVEYGQLTVLSGMITKNVRTIPLEKIQNINIVRPLVHRILGLVELQIETAGGTGVEAKIGALQEEDAEKLKAQLLGTSVRSSVFAQRPEKLLYHASKKDLFLAGVSENRAFAILAAVFGVFGVGANQLIEDSIGGFVKNAVRGNSGVGQPNYVLIGLGVLGFFLIGWLVSIVMSFVQYGNFEITQDGKNLRRSYGLVNQVESVVRIERIQVVRWTQTMIGRWLGIGKLFVETAGSYSEKDLGGQAVLAPVIRQDGLDTLLPLVSKVDNVEQLNWQPISKMYFLYNALGIIFWTAVSLSPLWLLSFVKDKDISTFFGWKLYAIVAGTIIVFSLITLYLKSKRTKWADTGEVLVTRKGGLTKQVEILELRNAQSVSLVSGWLQRQFGMASLAITTAARSAGGSSLNVVDLPLDVAEELYESISSRVKSQQLNYGDGM